MPHSEDPPDDDSSSPGAAEFAGIGLANAVCIFGGGALGWLVDRWLGTLPAFVLLGMVSGIVLGITGTYQRVRKYLN